MHSTSIMEQQRLPSCLRWQDAGLRERGFVGWLLGKDAAKEPSWGPPSHPAGWGWLGADVLKEDLRIKLAVGQEFMTYII